jgi:hypothetical protein
MAAFNIFNSSDEDVDSESLQPGSLGNIFGRDISEETLQPKGSPSFSDYLYDIIQTAPVKGVRTATKAILEIPASIADFALDTNLVSKLDTFFSEGFLKIPETQTGIGDIVALLVQYGLPLTVATKIAPVIPGLRGLSTFTKLDEIPSIAGKAGEIAKRAGYFGGLGAVTDTILSAPGINQTAGEQFGLYEPYSDEGLAGRDKAVERLKEKLKFGAEGAVLSGAIPLLPVAGTLGFKYGLKPAGQAIGYVGNNAIRAINYTVRNPIAEILSGGKVAGVNVPGVIPSLVKKAQSGMDTVEKGIINIHPALLPKYGGKGMYGARVHEAVIAAGEKQSGITIHWVNEHYDEGGIIFQAACEVAPSDTPETLANKIHALEHAHFAPTISKLLGV